MSLLHEFKSVTEPLRLEKLFPASKEAQPAELEIGCGDGGFLLEWATRHPKKKFLGIERLLGRIRKLDKKGRRANLTNLRLLRIEARYVLQHLLPAAAFEAVHIYFPDPWPKDKHRRIPYLASLPVRSIFNRVVRFTRGVIQHSSSVRATLPSWRSVWDAKPIR